jgi:hypothetical protein
MRVVCEQYRMRSPHWWLVDGALAVPIWVVELINKHVEISRTTVHGVPRQSCATATA